MLTNTVQVSTRRPKVPKSTAAQLRMSVARAKEDWLAKAARERMGMTIKRYAQHLGVAASSLYGYRDGDRPCPKPLAEKMTRELGIEPSQWPAGVSDF